MHFIIVAAFTAFVVAFWWRLMILGLVPFDVDTLCFYFPNWAIGRRLLESGSLLWDPYRNFGQPFLAVPQAQGVYPLRFLSPFFTFVSYTQMSVLLHTALSCFFAFRLARRRGLSEAGAAGVALVFGFSGAFFMRVVFAADFATIAWLPCLLYLREIRRPSWLALALALQWFAGYPPLFLVSLAVLVADAALDDDRRAALRTLLIALPLAAGLSAIQSIPFLEMMRRSSRDIILGAVEAVENSTYPIDLVRGLFLPSMLHDVFPRPVFFRGMFYLGPIVTGLALFGARRWGRKGWAMLGVAGLFFWFALGHFNYVTEHVPGFNVFRYQGNWVLGGTAFLALLAGAGVSAFRDRRVQVALVAAVALDLFLFARPLRHAAGDASFISAIDSRLPGFETRPTGRLLHHDVIQNAYPDWNWFDPAAWPMLKSILLSSYGTVFGLREATSQHNLTSREALTLRLQLNAPHPDPALFDVADVERIVTLRPDAARQSLPALASFSVLANPTHRGRVSVMGASTAAVNVAVDLPGRLEASVDGPGRLVFSEGIAPGWRARVDGKPVAIEPFATALMSFSLDAGRHDIVFLYRPRSFLLGWIISLFALILTAGLGFRQSCRRRKEC